MEIVSRKRSLDDFQKLPAVAKASIFPWSPSPPRKKIKRGSQHSETKANGQELYPNCDAEVWMRSCQIEIPEPITGKSKGKFPKWLKGSLIRNGPGSLIAGTQEFQHLFDASALLHRFNILNGQVTYQCKFLQSDAYKKYRNANRIVLTEFGTKSVPDPCHSIFKRVTTFFNPSESMSDNSMISIYPFGDEIYAFGESPMMHRINKTTLETEKRVNLYDKIGIINHTSHPHVLHDRTVYNLATTARFGFQHNIVCFPYNKNSTKMFEDAKIVASIPSRWPFSPSYMHTFGITENYFIIVEQPLNISIPSFVKCKLKNDPLISALKWHKDEQTQINVICRKTGKLQKKFLADTFFYLHIINQYEENDIIILDICCYRDPSMIECMFLENLKNMQKDPDYATMFKGVPLRFILPMKLDRELTPGYQIKFPNSKASAFVLKKNNILVKPEQLCDLGCETPRINYDKYLGKKYRYFYAISSDVDADNPGTIIKVDVKTKKCLTWCEPNCYPSEPIFVPSPKSKNEDEGIIVSSMVWGKNDTNHVGLIVLNAKTFKEIARTEFRTPSPVPKCLHGWFVK